MSPEPQSGEESATGEGPELAPSTAQQVHTQQLSKLLPIRREGATFFP